MPAFRLPMRNALRPALPGLILAACALLLASCQPASDSAPVAPAMPPATEAQAAADNAPPETHANTGDADAAQTSAPVAGTATYTPYAGEWPTPDLIERDGSEAELLVQFGDIDNFGYKFPSYFDPFSGRSTPIHPFPFKPGDNDAPGTDRIMVVSGYRYPGPSDPYGKRDGYTSRSKRPDNQPVPLRLAFDTTGIDIRSAALQLFVDDFQSPRFHSRFHVRINGRDLPDAANTLNQLDQTGPRGKLLTIQLLPEQLDLLAGGRIEIDIDDPVNNVGEGFAFDFARLLINPKPWKNAGTVQGTVTERSSGKPLAGVLVSASNTRATTTASDGRYVLDAVPAGLVVVTASHPDYLPASTHKDLVAQASVTVDLALDANAQTSTSFGEQLDATGRIDLYGIYFDTDQATLKPESETVLEQVRTVLAERPSLQVVTAGHTDAEGSDTHNLALSQRRAAAVVAWLVDKGIAADRLQSAGHGESVPVASNDTAEGRALNRRVEIRDAQR